MERKEISKLICSIPPRIVSTSISYLWTITLEFRLGTCTQGIDLLKTLLDAQHGINAHKSTGKRLQSIRIHKRTILLSVDGEEERSLGAEEEKHAEEDEDGQLHGRGCEA